MLSILDAYCYIEIVSAKIYFLDSGVIIFWGFIAYLKGFQEKFDGWKTLF